MPRWMPILSLLLSLGSCVVPFVSGNTYVNFLDDTTNVIPGAYGPVQAKVSSDASGNDRFYLTANLNAQQTPGKKKKKHLLKGMKGRKHAKGGPITMYSKGPVTAIWNSQGSLEKLVKDNQVCELVYDAAGLIEKINCSTSTATIVTTDDGLEASCDSCRTVAQAALESFKAVMCALGDDELIQSPSTFMWAQDASRVFCLATIKIMGAPASSALVDMTCTEGLNCSPPSFPNLQSGGPPLLGSGPPLLGSSPSGFAAGAACQADQECRSGICSGGQCLSEQIMVGGYCPSNVNRHCVGRGVCSQRYCLVLPIANDKPCPDGDNQDCESEICSEKTCLAQRIPNGQPCPDGDDNDCNSGVCSANICISGRIANGQPCPGRNADCVSGICLRGVCAATKLPNGAPCDKNDAVCASGACGLLQFIKATEYTCCEYGRDGTNCNFYVDFDVGP